MQSRWKVQPFYRRPLLTALIGRMVNPPPFRRVTVAPAYLAAGFAFRKKFLSAVEMRFALPLLVHSANRCNRLFFLTLICLCPPAVFRKTHPKTKAVRFAHRKSD